MPRILQNLQNRMSQIQEKCINVIHLYYVPRLLPEIVYFAKDILATSKKDCLLNSHLAATSAPVQSTDQDLPAGPDLVML